MPKNEFGWDCNQTWIIYERRAEPGEDFPVRARLARWRTRKVERSPTYGRRQAVPEKQTAKVDGITRQKAKNSRCACLFFQRTNKVRNSPQQGRCMSLVRASLA